MRIYLAALALLFGLAIASPAEQPCVPVIFTLHSSTGPVVIENACLDTNSYDGTLRIDAVDFGSTIFSNGFDPEGP